ncbi:hypothetical protein GO755_10790 [Spirosoma sp. HMF4905]|uniref:Outer membrane protein beta-barrel domain-containing protein n=1 Tax=Spirosoma arboris TaxID=2682092 RepID=A0A7K1S9R3_9BACT|nr:hypothetical protein [Spirosoma arboris]MVM30520.1 hypothetical protein [Spirosoma arboris]
MKRCILILLLLLAFSGAKTSVLAQGRNQVLFIGTPLAVGVGRYNATGFTTGLDIRYQQPLGSNITITGKTGMEFFLVKGRYRDDFRYYYGAASGISIPITIGPRFYIIDGLHAGLNLGVDIGVSRIAATAFRFEPAFGYVVRLPNHNYVDIGTSFVTSFGEGSGAFSFNFAYGLNLGR